MNILVVDNNQNDLEQTLHCLQSIYPGAQLVSFDDAMEAVRYGFNHAVDTVYTTVFMQHITGFDVARLLKKYIRKCLFVFWPKRKSICGFPFKTEATAII